MPRGGRDASHWMALFATYEDGNGFVQRDLLAASPLPCDHQTTSSSSSSSTYSAGPSLAIQREFIEESLHRYGRDLTCVQFLVGDTALGLALHKPALPCCAELLSRAIHSFCQDGERGLLVRKVDALMADLTTPRNRRRMAELTTAAAFSRASPGDPASWPTLLAMLQRLLELLPPLLGATQLQVP